MNPKFLTGAIIGLAFGVIGALVASNSRTKEAAAPAPIETAQVTETFHMVSPDDGVAITHSGDKPLPLYPAGIGTLSDDNIKNGFILLTRLRDQNGTVVGFTSEQEVVSPESDLPKGVLKTVSTWTLTIPGRGTIFLDEIENQTEFIQTAAAPALMQGKEWTGEQTFVTTAGPHESGKGLVTGGPGEFAGITGTFAEVTHLRRFTTKGELFGTIELQLSYRKPSTVVEAVN
jgi:hypothetical protein